MAALIGYLVAAVVIAVLVGRELTHRRREAGLRRELEQANLAQVGAMMSDFAEQLKAPLQGVLGGAELMLASSGGSAPDEDLRSIHDEASRAADIVRTMLVFTASTAIERRWSDLNLIVAAAVTASRPELDAAGVRIATTFAERLPLVYVDARLLERVLATILQRAAIASRMHGGGGTLVSVSTSRRHAPDDAIAVEVEDDCAGRAEESDAFSSGWLAACTSAVQAHAGRLQLTRRPRGIHVEIALPIEAAETPRNARSDESGVTRTWTTSSTSSTSTASATSKS